MKTQPFTRGLLALSLVCLLSACAPQAASTASSGESSVSYVAQEQNLAQRAQDYLTDFQAGEFESIFQGARQDFVSNYTSEELQSSWDTCQASARALQSQAEPVVTALEEGWMVELDCVHARYQLCTDFTFDQDSQLSEVAFSLEPLHVEPEEGESWYEVPLTLGYDSEKPLNGMLTLPRDVEAPPVVILVQGSGANSMDSLIGASNNRFFADLAHGLAQQGVAVIRYDKRSYAYPDDVVDIQTEYLYDVSAAVDFALEDSRVNGEQLYLIGHSQGGMLAPKLVEDNPEFKGFVSMGGTLRRMEDLILEQNRVMNAQNSALTPGERDAANQAIDALVEQIRALDADAQAEPDVLLYGYPETYWQSLNAIDSMALAQELSAEGYPMLILQGINDFQVSYDVDYALWQQTVQEDPNATCIAYEGLSHVFMPGTPEFDGTVYDPPAHVEPAVIRDIADWVHQQTDDEV